VIKVAFARLTFVKLKPDVSLDEVRKIWDDSVIPASKEQNGFIGSWLLVTDQGDEGLAVTLWESKDDALAGEESSYYQDQVKKFVPFLSAPPERKHYLVNSDIMFNRDLEAKVASMTITKTKTDSDLEETRKLYDDSVIPALRSEKGVVCAFMLVTEEKEESISFGLWESMDDAEAIQKSGVYREQIKKFSVYIKSIEGRKFYNVNSEIAFVKEIEAV
jgi:heme-degrading monooxygenase HmoA